HLGWQPPGAMSSAGKSEGPANQGAHFFGDFLLGKQKKVTSRRAAPGEVGLKNLNQKLNYAAR
ncbi:MAG: hypothetical protein AB7O69_09035, partial [Burkholderiales bacterium]